MFGKLFARRRGAASLGPSGHVDTFTRDNLPPAEQWPDLLLDRREFQYPEYLNAAFELTERMVEKGFGDNTALIGNGRRRTYKELTDWSNRLAHALVGDPAAAADLVQDTYEVALQLEVHAKSDQGVIYNVELVYGGLFRLKGVPPNLLQPVLFVDCPTILFPFLRRVLADVIRDGGFPPLMLDPIDFGRLYAQNLTQGQGDPLARAKN